MIQYIVPIVVGGLLWLLHREELENNGVVSKNGASGVASDSGHQQRNIPAEPGGGKGSVTNGKVSTVNESNSQIRAGEFCDDSNRQPRSKSEGNRQTVCVTCGFEAKTGFGLASHVRAKHGTKETENATA